jgi:hypothetical protein
MNNIVGGVDRPIEVKVGKYTRAYDYFVDFFGIFIPGLTFYSIFVILLFGFIFLISSYGIELKLNFFNNISNVKFEFSIISLILSYVGGFVFFRKGPKKVDVKSVSTVWEYIEKDNPPIDTDEKDNLEDKVQWPYEYLKRYLSKRLPHLAELVPWDPMECKKSSGDCYLRTKHFMNALKEQIRFYMPDKYFIVARNEAHVRLSSSVWYVMKSLFLVSAFAFISIGFVYLLRLNNIASPNVHFLFRIYLSFALSIVILSVFIQMEIQKFLFYQRVREIVYILNIAYQVKKVNPAFGKEFVDCGIWKS